ncbi:MAG: hypothetical protein H6797_03550 [Candidatus Nomurabacteria bacterium]|nr:MAG: hypothetical protein H6797_03550 [Candidatus Nomurabacteria bacterium]
MKSMEFSSFANAENAWTYDTPYDLARRREILENDGRDSRRFQDMENYIDYVNNNMPDDYMVATTVVKLIEYDPYSTRVKPPTKLAWLYRPDENGVFTQYKCVSNLASFVGDKLDLQDDDVYVVNTQYNVAIQPKPNKSVDMINIVQGVGDNSGHKALNNFEKKVTDVLGSYSLSSYQLTRNY